MVSLEKQRFCTNEENVVCRKNIRYLYSNFLNFVWDMKKKASFQCHKMIYIMHLCFKRSGIICYGW